MSEARLQRIAVAVHPERDISAPLEAVRAWARSQDATLGQLPGVERRLADTMNASEADLVVALGGDGTALAAIRATAGSGVPVMGLACGSLGVLTSVEAGQAAAALDAFAAGSWTARELPALRVSVDGEEEDLEAFNDIVLLRRGNGQARIAARVDGELFARFAGDGCVVCTALGSSAYTLAAGGPLLPLALPAYALTSLPAHGGSRPPVVLGGESTLELELLGGYGGARLEIDGQAGEAAPQALRLRLEPGRARVVTLPDQEPLLRGLRRRGIITDSPRLLAEDARSGKG